MAEFAGVDDHAALGAAVGDADDGALPGHPHGERLDLVEADVLVEAHATLAGAAGGAVLDAVALEHADGAVVHDDGAVDLEAAAAVLEHLVDVRVQPHALGDMAQLHLRHFIRVHLGRGLVVGPLDESPGGGLERGRVVRGPGQAARLDEVPVPEAREVAVARVAEDREYDDVAARFPRAELGRGS